MGFNKFIYIIVYIFWILFCVFYLVEEEWVVEEIVEEFEFDFVKFVFVVVGVEFCEVVVEGVFF